MRRGNLDAAFADRPIYVSGWYRFAAVIPDDGFAELPPFFPALQIFRPYAPSRGGDPTRCRCGASWRDPACYCGC